MKAWSHFKTITCHKLIVMGYCFRIGLYWQGLLHDMSKYSRVEFSTGIKYYQGNRSPNNAEREDRGFSLAWLHHKGRNKHHFEYWIDYSKESSDRLEGMKMPRKYVAEMFCDRVAACKVYQKTLYTDASPLLYFYRGKGQFFMHSQTRSEIKFLLEMLSEKGEKETIGYIRYVYLKQR